MKHDFIALEQAIWAATAHDVGVEPQVRWCTDYPKAIERALVVQDVAPLLRLLYAGEPLHPDLLPALADAFRVRANKPAGKKKALVTTEERLVASAVLYLRQKGTGATDAVAQVADTFGLSESVVKRAFDARVPLHLRPKRSGS